MTRSVLYMSMSLDGFITGPDDGPENGLGTGGEALHAWLFDGDNEVRGGAGVPVIRTSAASLPVVHEMLATGAVLSGRRTFDAARGWGGDHHNGVHIEVLTRTEPGADDVQGPRIRYATDGIEAAMARAKAAAGDRDVMVHGATTAQLALQAGVLDEIQIHQVPLLLGAGRSLFGTLGSPHPLELLRVIDAPGVTHLRYRVLR
ncbi:dihydrofolate reductase family protein [Sinomonas sp. R1AF57]|uniref:dihydrofolate reductase family protein n=1 Tax=Sinomonas sp. R1AF57 TaxID=2020377 RepID=UPI000B6059AB|nr:dihydrofolate reductase family protein [Sinomonas sp. R1AF57]ASN51953.1 riboflavin biosynthesis protein RibD [Sinomonas sp. R1AF57]